MNNIIKVILLNFILLYFLIKKNKSISMFFIVILFMYILYLRGNKLLEGQGYIDEKKDEVKFMKMANLDRLLDKMLNLYEDAEQDCIGSYSDFSPCDKKCGITHKYKTYRIERPAGLFGKSCIEEDGRRTKELCDESDGVFKCVTGESCQEDGDCKTNNCDPKTDRCVAKKVCSNNNLYLCNKEECIDLNNHYDYAEREFKYDEAESGIKCKLQDKETDTEDEYEEDEIATGGLDISTITAAECENNKLYWYLNSDNNNNNNNNTEQVTSSTCTLKIPNSIYYESRDDGLDLRNRIYGMTNNRMRPGLYCKIGYKFDNNDNIKGVTQPIREEDLNNGVEGKCESLINIGVDRIISLDQQDEINDIQCNEGYWPPLKYFTELNNLDQENDGDKIPIGEMCGRCRNGYDYNNSNCTVCREGERGVLSNQYFLNDEGIYTRVSEEMGKSGCIRESTQSLTCSGLRERGMDCSDRNKMINSENDNQDTTVENFYENCCQYCPTGKKYVDTEEGVRCELCPAGEQQNTEGNDCVICSGNNYREAESENGCMQCNGNVTVDKTRCENNICSIIDIHNGNCMDFRNLSDWSQNVRIERELICQPKDGKTFRYRDGTSVSDGIELTECSSDQNLGSGTITNEPLGENEIDFYDECCVAGCPGCHPKSENNDITSECTLSNDGRRCSSGSIDNQGGNNCIYDIAASTENSRLFPDEDVWMRINGECRRDDEAADMIRRRYDTTGDIILAPVDTGNVR